MNHPRTGIRYWVAITSPIQCILGGMAAWAAALLSNGPLWVTPQKVAAACVMLLSILGASVWHYGARADVYAKKHWDPVYTPRPGRLLFWGGASFIASIGIAWQFLPMECMLIAIINSLVIFFYARFLDQYWPWKNLSIAAICVTPLLLGWFSGHRLHPMVPPMIVAAFFFYFAREIFKDIVDIEANRGKRFTMVMDIGTPTALRVGGIILLLSILANLYSLRFAPNSFLVTIPSILGSIWLAWLAIQALLGGRVAEKFSQLDIGAAAILLSLLGARVG